MGNLLDSEAARHRPPLPRERSNRSVVFWAALGFYVGIVGDFVRPRGELNRENLVTILAAKETDILHVPDARDAPGLTAATRRRGLQETSEASLRGKLCHLRAARSSLTEMRAASSSSLSSWNVSRDASLWRHTGSSASSRV